MRHGVTLAESAPVSKRLFAGEAAAETPVRRDAPVKPGSNHL